MTQANSIHPPSNGETLTELHDRCAAALAAIISDADAALNASEDQSILICSHAAAIIAMGRVLTGDMPENPNTEDFDVWTCGISRFERKQTKNFSEEQWTDLKFRGDAQLRKIPVWRDGRSIGGGWKCTVNSSVDHLSGGPVRNW